MEKKTKTRDSNIQSAFLKGNTREHLLLFYDDQNVAGSVAGNQVIRIKFEIDIDPSAYAKYERKYRLLPAPDDVRLYDETSLFAGKIHAVICRNWKSRVKGRDLYDYAFYLGRGTRVNLKHLRAKLIDSSYITEKDKCSIDTVKAMLMKRFETIDYEQAKEDVKPFIRNIASLELWSTDFFQQITSMLQVA